MPLLHCNSRAQALVRLSCLRPTLMLLAVLCLALPACDPRSNQSSGVVSKDEGALPRLNPVPEFTLTNQAGRTFGSKDLAGKPYLAAFVFTRCPSVCPKVMARMKQIDTAMKSKNLDLELLSISVDPENDTPEVLTEYARKHGANVSNWTLLTGEHKTILATAEEGFKMGLEGKIDDSKPHLGITHGSHLVLVDKAGTIRGYYRSSDEASVSTLVEDMSRL
jgi:protein SCO1/2